MDLGTYTVQSDVGGCDGKVQQKRRLCRAPGWLWNLHGEKSCGRGVHRGCDVFRSARFLRVRCDEFCERCGVIGPWGLSATDLFEGEVYFCSQRCFMAWFDAWPQLGGPKIDRKASE